MFFDRFVGDIKFLGNDLLADALVTAEDIYIFLAGRKHFHRFFDQSAGIYSGRFVCTRQRLVQYRALPFPLAVLFPGYLLEAIEGMVPGYYHQVSLKAFHCGQRAPVSPYFKENVLYYFLCKLVGFSNAQDEISKLVVVGFE